MNAPFNNIVAFSIALLLTACGFHLRGISSHSESFPAAYWEVPDRYYDLQKALRTLLHQYGAVSLSEKNSKLSIRILEETSSSSLIALSPTSPVKQIVLDYTLRYRLREGRRTEQNLLHLQRQATVNDNQVYAGKTQETLLIQSARSDALSALLHRLKARTQP